MSPCDNRYDIISGLRTIIVNKKETAMIEIDGSRKSGSGTIVRDSVPYSVLTGEELRLYNIRAGRTKPGLRPQHLKGIEASAQLCRGMITGAAVGSREIRFTPGTVIRGGTFTWDIGTAGSATMLALSIIPLLLFADAPSSFAVTGGLFQDFAPSVYHVQHVVLPILKRMGAHVEIEIIRPGYVPRGNGEITVTVLPLRERLKPITILDRGNLKGIRGIALSSLLKNRNVSDRMAAACLRQLRARGYTAAIDTRYDTAQSPAYRDASIQPGASLVLWAETDTACPIGADMAGARGRPAELIGIEVARCLIKTLETTATVDEHVADQLIPFAALADGWSSYVIPTMTDHLETRLLLIEEFFGARTEINDRVVRIRGIGYRRS